MRYYSTPNCIKCYKQATIWGGHVHIRPHKKYSEKFVITSGWCEKHTKERGEEQQGKNGFNGCVGCDGWYNKKMGKIED